MSRLGMLFVLPWLPVFATVLWIFGGPTWVDCLKGMFSEWRSYWGRL